MIINPYRFAAAGGVPNYGDNSREFTHNSSQYLSMGDSDDFSFGNGSTDSPFSGACFVKFLSTPVNNAIFSKGNSGAFEWVFRMVGSDLTLLIWDNSAGSYIGRTYTPNLAIDIWYHAAFTYSGNGSASGIKLYLDGSQVDDADFNSGTYTAMENTAQPLWVGRETSRYLGGNLSDVRLYSKELSAAEVSDLNSFTHVSDSLVGWWLLDSNDIIDHSGNGHDGTESGPTNTTFSTDGPAD